MVIIGNRVEEKVRIVPGYRLKDYCKLVTDCEINIFNYQIELEIESIKEQASAIAIHNQSDGVRIV